MAKFSDLFGRKAGETGSSRPGARGGGNGNGNGHGEPISVESFSNVGTRMGEANESLRNLLSDTGRKIGELDDLKDAFEKIVAPFNQALRELTSSVISMRVLSRLRFDSRASSRSSRSFSTSLSSEMAFFST